MKERESHSKPKTKSGVLSQTVNSRGKDMKMYPRVTEKPVAELRYNLKKPYWVWSRAEEQRKGSETNHTKCQVLKQRALGSEDSLAAVEDLGFSAQVMARESLRTRYQSRGRHHGGAG